MILKHLQSQHKKITSNNKNHRRVITQFDERSTSKNTLKTAYRFSSKPKLPELNSKFTEDNPIYSKRRILHNNKPTALDKYLRTQPNQIIKISLPTMQTQKFKQFTARFDIEGIAGKGTFGVVYFGTNRQTGEKVAIKKVFQDRNYKNRQHTIIKMLKHSNILNMKQSFKTKEGQDQYLNIVMDYYPDNLYEAIKKKDLTPLITKIYAYQMFRGLNYLSMLHIAHRDIKPQNIMVDRTKHKLIITDFGSAKQLIKSEPNLAYICSRCYRAPELIFAATNYSTQIDMWSAGCVLVEMINGSPPFIANSQLDQLIQIIKILGTPSKSEVLQINESYDMNEYVKFPKIKPTPWTNILQTSDPLLIDLVSKILQYSPLKRINSAEALQHQYFDQLRDEARYQQLMFKLKVIPQFFDYSEQQLNFMAECTTQKVNLIPQWKIKNTSKVKDRANFQTSSTNNTKRSVLSYKAI